VKRGLWSFVLLLLTGVVCVSAIPQTDLPETSYNEVDTPVNQAPPMVQGIKFIRPARVAITLPRKTWEAEWNTGASVDGLTLRSGPAPHDPHLVQDLLCTWLI
jgi:hypothetical protein